jgi:hypothetical protein
MPTPPPLFLHVATAGKNHLNEKITSLLPTGMGERYCQSISNLGHAALAPMRTPPINESAELAQGQGLNNYSEGGPDKEQLELPVGGAGPEPVL